MFIRKKGTEIKTVPEFQLNLSSFVLYLSSLLKGKRKNIKTIIWSFNLYFLFLNYLFFFFLISFNSFSIEGNWVEGDWL